MLHLSISKWTALFSLPMFSCLVLGCAVFILKHCELFFLLFSRLSLCFSLSCSLLANLSPRARCLRAEHVPKGRVPLGLPSEPTHVSMPAYTETDKVAQML